MTWYMWVNFRKFGTPDAVRHIVGTQRLSKHTVRLHWHSERVYEAHEWRKPHPLGICSSRTSLCHAFIMHFLELPLCLWPFLRHFFHIGFPLLQSTLSPVHFFLLFFFVVPLKGDIHLQLQYFVSSYSISAASSSSTTLKKKTEKVTSCAEL